MTKQGTVTAFFKGLYYDEFKWYYFVIFVLPVDFIIVLYDFDLTSIFTGLLLRASAFLPLE